MLNAYKDGAKIVVAAMGRRYGKSTTAGVASAVMSHGGLRVAWCTPNFSNASPLWRWVRHAIGPLLTANLVAKNEQTRTIAFPNGGFLGMYSMENPDSIRGNAFDFAVLDECGDISDYAIENCISPCLADNNGLLLAIGTPKGQGTWFHRMWEKGNDFRQAVVRSFHAPTYANPIPSIQAYYHLKKIETDERTFAQEYDAVFLEASGGTFTKIAQCIRGKLETGPQYVSDIFVAGLDFGRADGGDATCMVVANKRTRQVVDFLHFTGKEWHYQIQAVKLLSDKWNGCVVHADATGIGSGPCEQLRRAGVPLVEYHFTNEVKKDVVDCAVLITEQNGCGIPAECDLLIRELNVYTHEKTITGLTRYTAPPGMHDDATIAFCLMCYGAWPYGISEGTIQSGAAEELLTAFKRTAAVNAAQLFNNYTF